MNRSHAEGNWHQLKILFNRGRIPGEQHGDSTDKQQRLICMLQESYGIRKTEAERLVTEWQWSEDRAAAFEDALRHNFTRALA